MFNLLKSDKIPYIKYGIYLIRKQTSIENSPPIIDLCNMGVVEFLLKNLEILIKDEQAIVRLFNFNKLIFSV